MAVEARRGCGYRKVGGLYLVGPGIGEVCHRLPFPLDVCPCCGAGIKQSRGWTWVTPALLGGPCATAESSPIHGFMHCVRCAVCSPSLLGERAGLLWVGAQFYRTTQDFRDEADRLGISRRISALPRGFVLGETWVLLAHPFACPPPADAELDAENGAGIFSVFKPTALEKLVKASEATPEVVQEHAKRGITVIAVPDDDPDHHGSVFDPEKETA